VTLGFSPCGTVFLPLSQQTSRTNKKGTVPRFCAFFLAQRRESINADHPPSGHLVSYQGTPQTAIGNKKISDAAIA
jgi:hypothetical protein